MSRNWIATVARTLFSARSASGSRPRRARTSPRIENLEYRLSLSSVSAGKMVPLDLNPQPLPPGFMMPMAIQGNHIGTAVEIKHAPVVDIVGNHIGTS